jgi:hypothetical protein
MMPANRMKRWLERYYVGQAVVYRLPKQGTRPGRRARNLRPSPHGETYVYDVDKYWRIAEFLAGDQLLLTTRRGKTHIVRRDDPQLRPASWWERLFYCGRFPGPPTGS